MGNSSGKPNPSPSARNTPLCHYEVLGVQKDASSDEIKKAYKQRALKLHPDKNIHDSTSEFILVQNAYQVLSNPSERLWYDSHRSSILRQSSLSHNNHRTPEDLMPFFSPTCYSGFSDHQGGFFEVYRSVFDEIEEFENEEEYEGGKQDMSNGVQHTSFGSLNTPFEPSLLLFYQKWTNFTSCRTYDHISHYNEFSDNRRHRRAASKENLKLREKFRRDFSDTVRSLALFVRRRDPRYKQWRKGKAAESETEKKESRRPRNVKDFQYVEQSWAKTEDNEDYLESMLEKANFQTRENENPIEELYCAPCGKLFKTIQQWENHERSKKHRTRLSELGIDIQKIEEPVDSGFNIDNHDISIPESSCPIEDELQRLHIEGESYEDCSLNSDQSQPFRVGSPSVKVKRERRAKKASEPRSMPFYCNFCKSGFETRNQLFRHIKNEGHALNK
jgi:DnaJ family protein A protein 5